MVEEKSPRRSAHRTQWAAQFAVASELCKRGYEVAFTMGNHPSVDLMVISPNKKPFNIDVKGLYKKNIWGVRARPLRGNLFYVVAYVPNGEANHFFILSEAQVNEEVNDEIERARLRASHKGRSDEKAESFPGVSWKFVEKFKDCWNILPS